MFDRHGFYISAELATELGHLVDAEYRRIEAEIRREDREADHFDPSSHLRVHRRMVEQSPKWMRLFSDTENRTDEHTSEGRFQRRELELLAELRRSFLAKATDETERALRDLVGWVPDMAPPDMPAEDIEQRAPFATEMFLYPLMGKEDARTLLSFLNALARACGYQDLHEVRESRVTSKARLATPRHARRKKKS